MKKLCLLITVIFTLSFITLKAQQPTQTVRGKVVDRESHNVLPFSVIMLFKDSVVIKDAEADAEGRFKITEVPIGRYSIKVSALVYLSYSTSGLVVDAGKETVLQITLEEQVTESEGVTILSTSKKTSTVNEMATVSTRIFTVDETNRYAGSRQDPVRMAYNFAGVQGNNDSRNDIIVRGNSPLGVVFRMDDVNIMNPNHFGIA